jgi:AraC-like DNA-binding protein
MEQELCRFIEVEIERIQNRLPPSTKRKVEDARGFIDKNFSRRDLSLDLVAEAVGLNPSYLSTIFKNECGCSLTRYIMNTRLENARQRMNEDPAVSVTALAEETGYTDAYYFSKSFKNQFGISPSKYLGNRNV